MSLQRTSNNMHGNSTTPTIVTPADKNTQQYKETDVNNDHVQLQRLRNYNNIIRNSRLLSTNSNDSSMLVTNNNTCINSTITTPPPTTTKTSVTTTTNNVRPFTIASNIDEYLDHSYSSSSTLSHVENRYKKRKTGLYHAPIHADDDDNNKVKVEKSETGKNPFY